MPAVEEISYGVLMANRSYPARKSGSKARRPAAVESIDDHSPKKLREQLANSLQELFPFLARQEHGKDKSELFVQYVDSLGVLGRCREEALQLAEAMVETSIELASKETASADFQAEILAPLQMSGEVPISEPENLATAEMATLEPAEILDQLQACLKKSIDKFVAELFDALDSLVDRSGAGLVHWTSDSTVKYHFFRRLITKGVSKVTHTQFRSERRSLTTTALIDREATTTPYTCSLAHHKHDLINAIQTSLDNSKVTMPPFVQELVEAIPLWMRPSIHIVEGYLINERIYECELFTKELTEVVSTEEIIHHSPLHGFDPAVCLGPYVLVGWGPREIGAEQQRNEKEVAQRTEQKNARFWGFSTVASQAFCALFAHQGFILLAMVLFVVSIACAAQWADQVSPNRLTRWQRQRIGLGFIALLGGLQLLFTPLSFSLVLTGIGLLIVGTGILSIDRGVLFRSFRSRD